MQVICKQSKVMYAFVGTFLGLFLFLLPYSTIFSPLSNLSVGNTIGSILYTFLLCVLLFCYLPNFRMIFDDSGITVLRDLKFFSYSLYKKEIYISWNDVIELDLPFTVTKFGLTFDTIVNYKSLFVTLSFMVTNVQPALEFAVTKLPSYKISKEARLKLKKKYGIIVE
jgi:hypothetical protein